MGQFFPETADIHSSTEEYAQRFSGSVGEFFLKRQEDSILKLLKDKDIKSVLDVGGGHAQIALPLAKSGYNVTVLGSEQSCSSRLSSALNSNSLAFQVGNLIELPFADRSFDAVISLRFISHCQSWPVLIKELCRVARQVVILDYPPLVSFNILTPLLFKIKRGIEGNTREYTIFKHSEIRREFALNNFRCERKIAQFFLPMGIHRAMKNVGFSKSAEGICKICALTDLFGAPIIAGFVPSK